MAVSVTWRDIWSEEDFKALPNVRSLVSIALQSQYSHSEKYRQLGDLFRDEIDASPALDELYTNVLNPETATAVHLDWWGKRVGVSRLLTVDGVETVLDDEFFRFLVFYRAVANISGSTAEAINSLLTRLTGYKTKIFDNQDMTVSIVMFGAVNSAIREIVRRYGLLNRGGGVQARLRIVDPTYIMFGFYGQKLYPFNVGVYNPATDIIIG